jgi:hypothetical protein
MCHIVISEGVRQEVKPYHPHGHLAGAAAIELPDGMGVWRAIHDLYKKYAISADSFARCVPMSRLEAVDINGFCSGPRHRNCSRRFAARGRPGGRSPTLSRYVTFKSLG